MLLFDYLDYTYISHCLLFSIVFFITYHKSRAIASLFGVESFYDKLSNKAKIEWNQRTVSMVHSLLVTPLAFKIAYITLGQDELLFMDPIVYITLVISGGYFIWDFYECLSKPEISGTAMIIHSIAGFVAINYVNLTHGAPVYKSFCAKMLIYELSTIPLNFKSFIQIVNSKSKYYEWSLMAFAISFLLVRDVWGIYATLNMCYITITRYNEIPLDKSIVLILEAIVTMILNINWGSLLLKKLLQKFKSGNKKIETYTPSSLVEVPLTQNNMKQKKY